MSQNEVHASTYTSKVLKRTESSIVIARRHSILDIKSECDVHGEYFSIGMFFIKKKLGELCSENQRISLDRPMILCLPPFSVLRWQLWPTDVEWVYRLFRSTELEAAIKKPILFSGERLPFSPLKLINASENQLVQILQDAKDEGESLEISPKEIVLKAKECIDKRFREQAPIQKLFETVHPSFSYLSRLFKETYGLSPVRYRSQLRLIQASVDLLFGSPSVEMAQWNVGIEDSSYFYQSFREHLKTTPAEFRRSYHIQGSRY